ncbi:MAG: hypothetical protein WCY93_06050 [Anaerolineaceae bacterium]
MATGGTPIVSPVVTPFEDPFDHPDALRWFKVMDNIGDLGQALAYPWDKWTIFLHPAQKCLVEGRYNGPARVSGSAGTGKTIVALHRAVYLARSRISVHVKIVTTRPICHQLRARILGA